MFPTGPTSAPMGLSARGSSLRILPRGYLARGRLAFSFQSSAATLGRHAPAPVYVTHSSPVLVTSSSPSSPARRAAAPLQGGAPLPLAPPVAGLAALRHAAP